MLVTLTGARRSGGGGCDDDNDNSHSSSTSGGFPGGSTDGGSGDDFDIDMPTIEPPTFEPPTYDPATEPAIAPSETIDDPDALDEVDITSCDYDENTQELYSDLTVTNSASSGSYNYTITVKVEQTEGGVTNGNVLATDMVTLNSLTAGSSQNVTSKSYYPLQEYTTFECSVTAATKYPSS
ncbi:hypothetical protein AQ490_17585 [Wenjunlia vitaminophila]|uniref:Uncharacterized protein n=1 Tax=Wenjunlia vitaminophila TaxID=76728 RepID=A0A0T6LVE2_WENVI|nr:hypothetical protein [Wenjunlia vitaminophila]KRV50037.1 hypothetical protein AQ490_17585 [Wenjunlia vitaminophila]